MLVRFGAFFNALHLNFRKGGDIAMSGCLQLLVEGRTGVVVNANRVESRFLGCLNGGEVVVKKDGFGGDGAHQLHCFTVDLRVGFGKTEIVAAPNMVKQIPNSQAAQAGIQCLVGAGGEDVQAAALGV